MFTLTINLLIVVNTLILALDKYPVDHKLEKELDILNIVFFGIFILEMLIKIVGLGPVSYIRDYYNIFDAIVGKTFDIFTHLLVSLSVVDVCLTYTGNADSENSGKGAVSAFRAFRLIRIFKLAKSWTQLNKLIQTILKSLSDISSFSVLLFLLIYIYILLGMQIFARNNSLDNGQSITIDYSKMKPWSKPPSRNTFENFFSGFIVVFTILTGENWD